MPTTFLKRQKEMKRQEKQREKAERRAQKKLEGRLQKEAGEELGTVENQDAGDAGVETPENGTV